MSSFDQDQVRALLQDVVNAAVKVGDKTGPTTALFAAETKLFLELGMAPFTVEPAPPMKLPVAVDPPLTARRIRVVGKIIRITPFACTLIGLDKSEVCEQYKLKLLETTQRGSSFSVAEEDLRRLRKAFFDAKSDDRSWKDRHKTPKALDSTIEAIDRVLEGKLQ